MKVASGDPTSLAIVALVVLVIGLFAMAGGALFGTRRAAVRELIWTSALAACLAMTVSLLFMPQILVRSPAVLQSVSNAASSITANVSVAALVDLPAKPAAATFPVERLIAIAWLVGACFLGLRLLRHLHAAARLRRRSVAVSDERWISAVRAAKNRAGFTGEIAVLTSPDIDVPLATGLFNPAIIFPTSASEWSRSEIDIVLLHEIAHITRRDLSGRLIAIAACALNWYNPIVWLLARRAYSDAELAADEAVLEMGIAGSVIAETLLNVRDRIVRTPNLEPVMLFAHPSLLPVRVRAVLELGTRRIIVPSSVRLTTLVGAFLIAGALGCFRFGATPSMTNALPKAVSESSADWTDAAAKGLIELLSDPSPQVRAASVKSLGQLAIPQTRGAIQAMLGDPEKGVEYEAGEALKNFSSR